MSTSPNEPERNDAPWIAAAPADSVEPPTPDRPRLGIIHLMLWAACVGLYMGVYQMARQTADADGPSLPELDAAYPLAMTAFRAVGAGASMAVLVLWVVWRRAGLVFPLHPGEYLWAVLGLSYVLQLGGRLLVFATGSGGQLNWVSGVLLVLLTLGHAVIWIWAAVGVKVPRWRYLFVAVIGLYVVGYFGMCILANVLRTLSFWPLVAGPVLFALILAVVAVRDHKEGRRYPWTHWAGVAVMFWRQAGILAWYLYYALWPPY